MAISFSGVNTWANEHTEATRFYTEALMGNSVVGLIRNTGTILTGVKENTRKLPRLSATSTMQDGDNCAFNADGSVTISQSTLTMKNLKFQDTWCARTMEDYFTAVLLPAGQKYEGLGQAEAAMVEEVRKIITKNIASAYFNETTLFDGLLQQLYDAFGINAGVTTPTNGGSAGTDAQGVFNICETLVNSWIIDEDLASEIQNGGVSIVMSPYDVKLYFENYRTKFGDNPWAQQQLVALAGGAQSFTHPGTNVTVYSEASLTTSRAIIMYRNGNPTLGFDLESDNTAIEFGLDQYKENIWYTLRTKVGATWRAIDANNVKYWGSAS